MRTSGDVNQDGGVNVFDACNRYHPQVHRGPATNVLSGLTDMAYARAYCWNPAIIRLPA